jgi:RNA polymerase sigma factor (sigma-70 family)
LRLRRESVLRSRAARGDAAAFAAVYERHHQALYRYCRSILRHEEDAQDALQSTFTRAFAALQDERRDFELRPWLFRIAHNEAISILRRRRDTAEIGELPGEPGETEARFAEREELRVLQLDLADLPERQRAALVLRELNGLSHAEIGEVLEVSPAAVKQAIFEARSALFSCREGRDMACEDVRRMLSDGDGRVLRGRGVRAHLRTCPDCRRFKADLERRPQALRMLAPPLPTATAAALLSQLLGGSTAKLLACVAIAGGGTTLAVEMQHASEPARPAAAERSTPEPRRSADAAPRAPQRVVPVTASEPQATQPSAEPRAERRTDQPGKRERPRRPRPARLKTEPAAAVPVARVETSAPSPATSDEPAPQRRAKPPKAEKEPKAEKRAKADKPPKPDKPPKAEPPRRAEVPASAQSAPRAQAAPPQQVPTAAPAPPSRAEPQRERRARPDRPVVAAPVFGEDEGDDASDDDDD